MRTAIRVVIGLAGASAVAFVAVAVTRWFTDKPGTDTGVGIVAWAVAFGAFLWASDLQE